MKNSDFVKSPIRVPDPFIGRDEEMRVLLSALEDAENGDGCIVMISGEPGIGKTRCAEELSALAQTRHIETYWGHCHESLGTPAYWPWVEAIESYIRTLGDNAFQNLLSSRKSVLADFLPSIRSKFADIPPAHRHFDPTSAQFSLFSAVADLLSAMSHESPKLIVLEDLNWADAQTLQLLEFFTDRIGTTRLLLLGTYRDVEVSRKHPLAATLGELVRSRAFRRLSLKRFSESQVQMYLNASLGSSIGGVSQQVFDQTDGNPFFLKETVQQLNENPKRSNVAESIRQAVGKRLDRLSQECSDLLATAAIIGRDFSVNQLTRVFEGLNEQRITVVLAEAMEIGLIEETTAAFGGFRFTHALIRETLVEEISLTKRVQMHAAVAIALERLYGDSIDNHSAEVLYHLKEAQLLLGTEKVVRYALLAGERALATYAFEEAGRCFDIGLVALGDAPMDESKAALSFGMARVIAVSERGDLLYRDGYRRMLDAFSYYVDTKQTERALQIASLHMTSRIFKGAMEMKSMYETALKLVPTGSVEEARLLCFYAGFLWWHIDKDSPIIPELLSHAGELARRHKDPNLIMLVLNMQSASILDRPGLARIINESEQLTGYDDTAALQEIWLTAGFRFAYWHGDVKESFTYFDKAYRLADITHTRRQTAASGIVGVHRDLGGWEDARQFVLNHPEIADHPGVQADLAAIEFETGNEAIGEEIITQLIERVEATEGDPKWEALYLAVALPDLVRRGASVSYLDFADRIAERILESQERYGTPNSWMSKSVRPLHAFISAVRGDMHTTAERVSGTKKHWNENMYHHYGFILIVIGKFDEAITHLKEIEEYCDRTGYRPRLAWALYDRACAQLGKADPSLESDARNALSRSSRIAEDLSMVQLSKLTAEKIKGIDALHSAKDNHKGLTKRELEVLRCLASGKTNQEISQALYISDNTVRNHLSKIFGKLGVGNRTEAANAAFHMGLVPRGPE